MLFAIVFAAVASLSFAAEENINNLFQKVKYTDNSIIVTFPDQGVRYSIKLNEKDLGINQYKETLSLKQYDTLVLTHKHGSYTITPVFKKNKVGLNIKSLFYWGKEKTDNNYFIEAK